MDSIYVVVSILCLRISPLLTWTGQPPLFFACTGGLGGDAASARVGTRMPAGRCRNSAAMIPISERLQLEKVPFQLQPSKSSCSFCADISREPRTNRGGVFHDCTGVITWGLQDAVSWCSVAFSPQAPGETSSCSGRKVMLNFRGLSSLF